MPMRCAIVVRFCNAKAIRANTFTVEFGLNLCPGRAQIFLCVAWRSPIKFPIWNDLDYLAGLTGYFGHTMEARGCCECHKQGFMPHFFGENFVSLTAGNQFQAADSWIGYPQI